MVGLTCGFAYSLFVSRGLWQSGGRQPTFLETRPNWRLALELYVLVLVLLLHRALPAGRVYVTLAGGLLLLFAAFAGSGWPAHEVTQPAAYVAWWVASVIVTFAIAALGLWFLRRVWRPIVRKGPYCLGCGYCVVALPRPVCPECGTPFTADELGITRAELLPRPRGQEPKDATD